MRSTCFSRTWGGVCGATGMRSEVGTLGLILDQHCVLLEQVDFLHAKDGAVLETAGHLGLFLLVLRSKLERLIIHVVLKH